MAVDPIPEGYHTVTPYLIVKNVGGLIDFMTEALGAEERMRHGRPDGTVMHAEVKLGDSIIMLGEAAGEFTPRPSTLHMYAEDSDAVYRSAMAAGATSLREPEDQFYGDRISGFVDPSGNQWWIATHIEDVSEEEMQRRQEKMG